MNEGYMALTISILRNVTPERAFRILYGDERWIKNKHWTKEDIAEIECLKQQGMNWREIGKMYGVSNTAVYQSYRYYKKKIESSH